MVGVHAAPSGEKSMTNTYSPGNPQSNVPRT